MTRVRSWTDDQLVAAVKCSYSIRGVIKLLNLVPAGGNYTQVNKRIYDLELDTTHFTGSRWNVGSRRRRTNFGTPLGLLLVNGSEYQSYKLKNRLIREGVLLPYCVLCGWCEHSPDGRLPLELDHINGDHKDNRLENLRILCPNCHSLQPTHRGKNKKVRFARVL